MHRWGDPGVDWEGIEAAGKFIREQLEASGIVVTDCKEKWGMVRIYCALAPHQAEAYQNAYLNALKKYPHLKAEILGAPDFPEFLQGLEQA